MNGVSVVNSRRFEQLHVLEHGQSGARQFFTFRFEMVEEEGVIPRVFIRIFWREHHRQNRSAGIEHHTHDAIDDGMGYEFMPVNTAIHEKATACDQCVISGLREFLRLQWQFERTGDFNDINERFADAGNGEMFDKTLLALTDDVCMPAGFDKSDAFVAQEVGHHVYPWFIKFYVMGIQAPTPGLAPKMYSLSSRLLLSVPELHRVC